MSYYQSARGSQAGREDQPQPADANLLIGQFLVKLELLRLTEFPGDGSSSSRAEFMLAKENEILRSRLATLKENISVLNKMIEQIKQGDLNTRHRSVSQDNFSYPRSAKASFSALKRTKT
jgi:hypothetical protein